MHTNLVAPECHRASLATASYVLCTLLVTFGESSLFCVGVCVYVCVYVCPHLYMVASMCMCIDTLPPSLSHPPLFKHTYTHSLSLTHPPSPTLHIHTHTHTHTHTHSGQRRPRTRHPFPPLSDHQCGCVSVLPHPRLVQHGQMGALLFVCLEYI
jgi:hypothetical protein